MGASSSIMAATFAIQGVNSIVSSQYQAAAMRAQGAYQKQQADANARLALVQSDDALKRGDLSAGVARRKGSAIEGSQRLAAAAQGIDINSGSALDLQNETAQLSDIDVNTIKNNSWREAWGFRVQANDYTSQGKMAATSSEFNAQNTLLTGGIQAAGNIFQAGAYYERGKTLDKLDFSKDTVYQGETPPNEKTNPDRLVESEKSRIQGEYADNQQRQRSKKNPLFPGYDLVDSWWVTG